jgi:hypothetical protein
MGYDWFPYNSKQVPNANLLNAKSLLSISIPLLANPFQNLDTCGLIPLPLTGAGPGIVYTGEEAGC